MTGSGTTPGTTRPASAGAVLPDVEGAKRIPRLTAMADHAAIFEGRTVNVLEPAETAKPATLAEERLQDLVRAALALADDTPSFVWVDGDSELAIHADRTRVALGPGLVLVGLAVECDQTGPAEVTVPFALGSKDRAAGMIMSAPARADGPAAVVERWGAVLVAAAYRALLDVATGAAAAAGVDRDGGTLIPGAVESDGKKLTVLPQARHTLDRGRLL